MPTQLQLDGPDLEGLLGRVRDELGPQARIVSAEKVRTGGLGGFFARERFEICVETDGSVATADDSPASPTSLLDLADAVSDQERVIVSTESATFGEVMRQLGADGGQPPSRGWLPTARPQQPGAPAPDVPVVAVPSVAATAGEPPAVATRDASAHDVAVQDATGHDVAVQTGSALPASAADPARAWTPPVPRAGGTARTAVRRPLHVVPEAEPHPGARLVAGLTGLGMPRALLPDLEDAADDLHSSLLACLSRLPHAAPVVNSPGQVLAVVGPGPLALAVSLQVAAELDLDPRAAVLLAGTSTGGLSPDRVLGTPSDVAQRRSVWQRRQSLTILAIEAAPTIGGAALAAERVAAADAGTVWGVVEASRKAADIARWTEFLGGVDALAVQDLESSADPATVLGLGLPVARLGHVAGSAQAWVSLLCRRLAA